MSEPLIHFLIPYVGRLDYLDECVQSVLPQSDPRWRLTVVEDGPQGQGTDGWLAGLSDERIEHRLNPTPLGLARNFQHCLLLADAPYLVVLGCDDRLLDNYVAHVAHVLQDHPKVAAVQPGVEVIDQDGLRTSTLADRTKILIRPRGALTLLSGEGAAASLMRGNWTYFPSLCWRTDTIRELGFRTDLPTTLDLDLLCRLILTGHSIAVTPSHATFQYRRHAASASSVAAADLARFDEEKRLFKQLEKQFDEHGWRRAARAARWHLTSRIHALSRLPTALASRDLPRASQVMGHAFGMGRECSR